MRIGGKKIDKVRVYGDTFLAKKAEPVKSVDDKTLKFAEVLTNTMIEFDGVGLAAIGYVPDPVWTYGCRTYRLGRQGGALCRDCAEHPGLAVFR